MICHGQRFDPAEKHNGFQLPNRASTHGERHEPSFGNRSRAFSDRPKDFRKISGGSGERQASDKFRPKSALFWCTARKGGWFFLGKKPSYRPT